MASPRGAELSTLDEPVLSSKAWEHLSSCTKSRQRRLIKLINKLAYYPFQLGDYQTTHSVSRPIENLRIGLHMIIYCVDHAEGVAYPRSGQAVRVISGDRHAHATP